MKREVSSPSRCMKLFPPRAASLRSLWVFRGPMAAQSGRRVPSENSFSLHVLPLRSAQEICESLPSLGAACLWWSWRFTGRWKCSLPPLVALVYLRCGIPWPCVRTEWASRPLWKFIFCAFPSLLRPFLSIHSSRGKKQDQKGASFVRLGPHFRGSWRLGADQE